MAPLNQLAGVFGFGQTCAVKRLFELTKTNGLLIGKGGLMGNVIRITPPLNVAKDQVDQSLTMLDRSFGQMGL